MHSSSLSRGEKGLPLRPRLLRPEAALLEIPFVTTPPGISGDLRDPCWKQAATVSRLLDVTPCREHQYHVNAGDPHGFDPAPVPQPARPATRVGLCHDGHCLYAAFRLDDPSPQELRRRDRPFSTGVEREDCVFLWFDPSLAHLPPYVCEYIVNAAGQKSEFIHGHYSGDYCSLMAWEGRVRIERRAWTASVRIPLERLGLAVDGKNGFGFNFGRGYRGDWQTHAWQKPDGNFPPGWGFAVLGSAKASKAAIVCGVRIINTALEAHRRGEKGIALAPNPGSVREPGRHRDSNALLGISVWGPEYQPTIALGRADSYDRRWYGNELPVVTRQEVIAAAAAPAADRRLNELRKRSCGQQYSAYPNFPSPKPVGQLILGLPGGAAAGWRTEVGRGEDGAVKLTCRRGRTARLDLTVFVHKGRNLTVIQGCPQGLSGEELSVRLYRNQDNPPPSPLPGYDYDADLHAGRDLGPLPPPEVGHQEATGWLRQRFPKEPTFPAGFAVLAAASVRGAKLVSIREERAKTGLGTPARSPFEGWVDAMTAQTWAATHFERQNATPGSAVTLTARLGTGEFTVLCPIVSTNDNRDTLAAAQRIISEATTLTSAELICQSRETPLSVRVGGYCYQQDLPITSVFTAKFCTDDSTMWHGDYHFNEFYFDFITRPVEELEPFLQMVETNLPAARTLAREAFGCGGAAFPVASFPAKLKRLPFTNLDFDYSIECTGLVFQPFWHAWLYSRDRTFLDQRAYPALREAARFYADYATPADDGLLHLWPCTSSEHVPLQPGFPYNRDSIAALTMARYCLRAAIRGARLLRRDDRLARTWEFCLAKLAPYPTEMTSAGARYVDTAGARLMTEYNIFQPLAPVFFGDDIGLASPADEQATAQRSLDGLIRLSTTHWPHVYRAMRRLGTHPGGPLQPENLLQSHQGPLFLFPAVPTGYSGEFRDYRATGAFRVSAWMEQGAIHRARIESLAGEPCEIALRGFPRTPQVWRGAGKSRVPACIVSGAYLRFETTPGAVYELDLGVS